MSCINIVVIAIMFVVAECALVVLAGRFVHKGGAWADGDETPL